MKTKQKKELHTKTVDELTTMIKDMNKELYRSHLDHKEGKLKDTRSLYQKRKAIAVVQTIVREKEVVTA